MALRACSRINAAASTTKSLVRVTLAIAIVKELSRVASNVRVDAQHQTNAAARPPYLNRTMRLAALLQVTLMILLRAPKFRCRFDLRYYCTIETSAFFHFFFRSCGYRFLLGRMIKNHGAILRAHIRALPVQCSGVMIRPENIQELV